MFGIRSTEDGKAYSILRDYNREFLKISVAEITITTTIPEQHSQHRTFAVDLNRIILSLLTPRFSI